jgi:hypothetical protein
LIETILPESPTLAQCTEAAYKFLRNHKLEPFSPKELERYIRSAYARFEEQFFSIIIKHVPEKTILTIEDLLKEDNDFEPGVAHLVKHFGTSQSTKIYSEARRLYLCRVRPRQKIAEIRNFFLE